MLKSLKIKIGFLHRKFIFILGQKDAIFDKLAEFSYDNNIYKFESCLKFWYGSEIYE